MSASKSTFAHSRQNSQDSEGTGASYQLILEHILSYPNTYEIPLRTMYTLNCAPRAQPPSTHPSRAPSPTSSSNSPTSPQFSHGYQSSTAQFTTALMGQLSQLPSQPSSLPPSFVTTFVNRCFPVELEFVDFPQSLTALDYLKDLETRRRKEIAHSFQTLNLDQTNLSEDKLQDLRQRNPAVAEWVESLEAKLRKVESAYGSIYISLRRWVCTRLCSNHGVSLTPARSLSMRCVFSLSTKAIASLCSILYIHPLCQLSQQQNSPFPCYSNNVMAISSTFRLLSREAQVVLRHL